MIPRGHEAWDLPVEMRHRPRRVLPLSGRVVIGDVAEVQHTRDVPAPALLDDPFRLQLVGRGVPVAVVLGVGKHRDGKRAVHRQRRLAIDQPCVAIGVLWRLLCCSFLRRWIDRRGCRLGSASCRDRRRHRRGKCRRAFQKDPSCNGVHGFVDRTSSAFGGGPSWKRKSSKFRCPHRSLLHRRGGAGCWHRGSGEGRGRRVSFLRCRDRLPGRGELHSRR